MANLKISDYVDVDVINGNELILISKNGAYRKTTIEEIRNLANDIANTELAELLGKAASAHDIKNILSSINSKLESHDSQLSKNTQQLSEIVPNTTLWYLQNIDNIRVGAIVSVQGFYDIDNEDIHGSYRVLAINGTENWTVFNNTFKISDSGEIAQNKELTTNDKKLKYLVNNTAIPEMLGANLSSEYDNTLPIQLCLNNYDITFLLGRKYTVTNLNIPQSKTLEGASKRKSILYSESQGFILSTIDNSYMSNIRKLSLISNKNSDGIHFKYSVVTECNNTLEDIFIKSVKQAFLADKECVGFNMKNVFAQYCGTGFTINGTDNFISDCIAGVCDDYGFLIQGNNYVKQCKAYCCNGISGTHAFIVNSIGSTITGITAQQNYKSGLKVTGKSNLISVLIDSNGWYNSSITEVFGIDVSGSYNNIQIASREGLWQCYQTAPVCVRKEAFLNTIVCNSYMVKDRIESYTGYIGDNYDCKLEIENSQNDVTVNGVIYSIINRVAVTFDYTNYIPDGNNAGSVNNSNGKFTLNMDNFTSLTTTALTKIYLQDFATLINSHSEKYLILKYKIKCNTRQIATNISFRRNGSLFTEAFVYNNYTNWVARQYAWVFAIYDLDILKANIGSLTFAINCFKTSNFSGNTGENVSTGIVEIKDYGIYFSNGEIFEG